MLRAAAGIAELDPVDYRLILHGLVDRPLIFTLDDIKRMPRVNRVYFCECAANSGHGVAGRTAQRRTVHARHGPLRDVYRRAAENAAGRSRGEAASRMLLLEGGDAAAMSRSLPMQKALEDVLIAYRMNGEMLYPENGYPVRAVVPGWEANIWVEVAAQDRGRRPAVASPRGNLQIHRPAGERYCPAIHLRHGCEIGHHRSRARRRRSITNRDFTVLSGLAWSGRGRITRVDVSLDGGAQLAARRDRRSGGTRR